MRTRKARPPRAAKRPPARKHRRPAKAAPAPAPHGAKTGELLGRPPTAPAPSAAVPRQWRWHHRVLLALQTRLLRDRGDLLRAASEPLEPHSLSEADSATDEFDHDLALAQLSAEQDALYEVNEALRRIENGSYGVCEETGAAIPAARLKAIPWTRFTREVEERLEKKGVVAQVGVRKSTTVRSKARIWLAPEEEAEEVEEESPAPAKDEALFSVTLPQGGPVSRRETPQRRPKASKRKGRHA